MDKKHFVLMQRYKAIMKDGSEVKIGLKPESKYYFSNQETKYLIFALRDMDIDINEVKEIVTYFEPFETEEEINITIGV